MRLMKRPPKRHGLWRLHCSELTVICCDCCTATATTCTASYISAASVCKQEGKITRHFTTPVDTSVHLTFYPSICSPAWKHKVCEVSDDLRYALAGTREYKLGVMPAVNAAHKWHSVSVCKNTQLLCEAMRTLRQGRVSQWKAGLSA